MENSGKIWSRRKRVLRDMRLNFLALGILAALTVTGALIIRTALLRNAWNTGMALARNYASEEQGTLVVYETLLTFGTSSVERRIPSGSSEEELTEWLEVYFERLESVLGEGLVDPYAVVNGRILAAANPWEEDDTYDVYSTEWYQKAEEANGEVIFTDLYTDAITQQPVITIAQKCQNADALLAFDVFPENFPFQFNPLDLSSGDSFYLCDSLGRIFYMQTNLTCPDEEVQQYLSGIIQKIEAGSLKEYNNYIIDLDGSKRTVCYTLLENGWYSIITIPYSNIMDDMEWTFLFFAMIIGIFLLALIGMAWRDMRVNARIDRTNETVRALGNSYFALYRVNYERDTYEMIKASDYIRSQAPPEGCYSALLRLMATVIEPDACEDFAASFSPGNIRELVSKRVRGFGGEFLRLFNGEYSWVSVQVLFDESLSPGEVVLSFRTVDEEKQRQLQERRLLEDALEVARKNESAKQTFFSSMSHDMRTPLNAIIGLSTLAERYIDSPAEMTELLHKINAASHQLLELINDILDMSRMEQGKLELDRKPINLRECLEECLGPFRLQAAAGKKELVVQVELEDPVVMGDPFRITQILNNLLSNALKFTGEGGSIQVTLTQMDRGEYAKYKLVVADTGIGMSKDFLPHVFEPYTREMRFSSRRTLGTGLGMSITKNLVSQMDGEIQVESEAGKGSTFTIVLPFAVVREQPVELAASEKGPSFDLKGRRVLLAEDNEVNMEIAVALLEMNGVLVTQAWNGLEAVEKFRTSELFYFDAVLMDMQMPQMDGCDAARNIRSLHRPDAGAVPIIAVTANAFAEDVAATAAAGMDAHISKPIDFPLLCQTLGRLISGKKEN